MQLTYESGKIQECTDRVIAHLHNAWLLMRAGDVAKMQPDPFYDRNEVLTAQVVADVIKAVEGIFISELQKYMSYHRAQQGVSSSQVLVPPGFDKLPYPAQRWIVQGLDRILQEYRYAPMPNSAATAANVCACGFTPEQCSCY